MPVWRAALKQFGRGTLGLHVGAAMPSGTLLEYVAGASPNLRAASARSPATSASSPAT